MPAEQAKDNKQKLWFIRRGETIKGPFPSGTLRRFMLLGRVVPSDQVSLDRKNWQGVMDVPEVVPPEIRKAAAEGNLYEVLPTRLGEDERKGTERRNKKEDIKYENQRKGQRRQEESGLVKRHQLSKTQLIELYKKRKTPYLAFLVVSIVVFLTLGIGLYIGAPDEIPDPDCNAKAAPGVNWRNCRLDAVKSESVNMRGAILNSSILRLAKFSGGIFNKADMQYADLSGSDLSYSEIADAKMKGINLQNADLTNADLTNSDLSYANLKNSKLGGAKIDGARLSKAIWIDGSVCGPGSVGKCVKETSD
jgi:hypothetical protein